MRSLCSEEHQEDILGCVHRSPRRDHHRGPDREVQEEQTGECDFVVVTSIAMSVVMSFVVIIVDRADTKGLRGVDIMVTIMISREGGKRGRGEGR